MARQPLSVEERDRAYAMQERLDAQKECGRCERWLPVSLFDGYGFQPCDACCRALAVEYARTGGWARWKPLT